MSELRQRFIETLQLKPEEVTFPDNSKYFVAIGAGLMAERCEPVTLGSLLEKISEVDTDSAAGAKRLEPLFRDAEEYRLFRQRHDNAKIAR